MKTHSSSTSLLSFRDRNLRKKTVERHKRRHFSSPLPMSLLVAFVVAAVAFASFSVSASRKGSQPTSALKSGSAKSVDQARSLPWNAHGPDAASSLLRSGLLPIPTSTSPEAIATYEVVSGSCTATPKTTFELGDDVCARAVNAPLGSPTAVRRFNWAGTKGFVRQSADVTADPDTNIFTLPLSNTSVIEGVTVDNRGTWTVSLNSTADNITRAAAYFAVSDPDNRAADLVVYNFSLAEDVLAPGANTSFFLWFSNPGPDAADNVHLTMAVPPNMSFTSANTTSSLACSESAGVIDCSTATWANGAVATVTLNFSVDNGAPNGLIAATANISSDTNDPRPESNSSDAVIEVRAAGAPPATCALGCPPNITVTASSSSGAVVDFSNSVEISGDCGTITYSPASGSTFPIGITAVNVTSVGGTGGSCSFLVTVIDPDVSPAPTISCPADQSVVAPSGQSEASVSTGTPTATGTGVAVTGVRNDNRDVTDPFPIGTTTITWTATDADQRTASCTQHIVVTSADAPTITCPSNKTFDAAGDCQKTLTAADIGTPTPGPASGPFVPTVTSRRSDDLPLTNPYPAGQTVITWTATNDIGSVSCTQIITITSTGDSTPPTLTVPNDVSVTTSSCSALVDDELGVATATDNCSTVSISRSGVPTVPCPIPGNPTRTCETFVFPVGTTDVTYTATDAQGNTATGVQHVTVHELSPPVFTFVPGNVGPINNDPNLCGAYIGDATLGMATVFDNCDTTVIRTGVPAGNIFPVGQTTITYTAKADITVTATQIVTVVDNTPPVVTPPGAVTLYTGPGATSCSVTVSNLDATLGTGSATDNCPRVGAVVRSGVPAGNVFPLGPTTLTYSATDASNNTGSANQTVTVIDNTLPVISCPASITLEPTCPSGAIAMYTEPVGTDNCAGATTARTAGGASGSVFPIGTTTVTYTVNDAHGNSASCSFTVTVKTASQTIQDMKTTIDGLPSLTGTQKQGLKSKLDAVLEAIAGGKTNVACNKLNDFISQVTGYINNGTLTSAQGQPLIISAQHAGNTIGCTNNPCT
jgi:hypothetical protein